MHSGCGGTQDTGLAEQSSGLRGSLLSPLWGQVQGWQGCWLPGPGAGRISSFLFVRLWAGLQPAWGSALRGAEGPRAYKHSCAPSQQPDLGLGLCLPP